MCETNHTRKLQADIVGACSFLAQGDLTQEQHLQQCLPLGGDVRHLLPMLQYTRPGTVSMTHCAGILIRLARTLCASLYKDTCTCLPSCACTIACWRLRGHLCLPASPGGQFQRAGPEIKFQSAKRLSSSPSQISACSLRSWSEVANGAVEQPELVCHMR